MSEPAVSWGQLRKFLSHNGFEIDPDGGDKLVSKDGKVHRIGHLFATSHSDQISKGHLTALRHKFGITPRQIRGMNK